MNRLKNSYAEISAVRCVDTLIHEAVECGASDIHLEPIESCLRVRFRIDGVLIDRASIDASIMQQVISRFKVLAHMDIAEKRVPQDGKFVLRMNGTLIDFRVSTFPSLYGQKMVVRILDRSIHAMRLEHLGLSDTMLRQFLCLIKRQQGLLLVTGPTGSGKTTTLYAALSVLNTRDKNIVTLEDPVEYNLDGITQGQINPETGFTFEKGIRSILRQDPDILMIGEIRDKQTARIAIEAALTGHLVLSTMHTNDTPSALMRLMDMGIEPFLINAALIGVLAQRLVRTVCASCKEIIIPTQQECTLLAQYHALPITQIARGKGCDQCEHTGYKGRIGVFELLEISHALRLLMIQQPNFNQICAQTKQDGLVTLLQDGMAKVIQYNISLEECMRLLM